MPDFWHVITPVEWPHGPDRLSPTSVVDIETCPRRYALSKASYGPPINGRYPDRPSIASLRGQVVHLAMEYIVEGLRAASSGSLEGAVKVLRSRGGISRVLEEAIATVLTGLASNPRAADRLTAMEQVLTQHLGAMRQTVQFALQRLLASDAENPSMPTRHFNTTELGRMPLAFGLNTEVRLEPHGLGWVGIADAIRLTSDVCEIVDYKTGVPSEEHAEQLRIYALLWARDRVVNPRERMADSLTLIYPTGSENVAAPKSEELDELELTLAVRLSTARSAVSNGTPRARVSPSACRFCSVKQLCSDYWDASSAAALRDVVEPAFRSVQVVLRERRALGVWTGVIGWDVYSEPGTPVVIQFLHADEYESGNVLRLIDVVASRDDVNEALVLEMQARSEAFKVA